VTPRLATSIWVSALLRRADAAGVFGAVLRRGDPVAGAVILVARAPDGRAQAWTRVAQGGSAAQWALAIEASAGDGAKLDEYLARQARYDPDVWAVELVTEQIQPFVAEPSHMR